MENYKKNLKILKKKRRLLSEKIQAKFKNFRAKSCVF